MKSYRRPFVLDGELAMKYGDREALMITHFQYWIDINKANNRNFRDGRYWTYQTYQAIAAHFPFWTMRRVRTILDSLVAKGVLIKGNYNKSGFDKTVWYAFKNEEIFTIAENGNGVAEIDLPIPKSKPESKLSFQERHCLKEPVVHNSKPKDPGKTLPFSKEKRRDIGNRTKHPLKRVQQETYDLLVMMGIETNHDALCAMIRSHSHEDIVAAIAEYRERAKKGSPIRKPIAFFRSILKKMNQSMRNICINRSWINELCESMNLPIDVYSTYVIFSNGKEIPMSYNHKAFKEDVLRVIHGT